MTKNEPVAPTYNKSILCDVIYVLENWRNSRGILTFIKNQNEILSELFITGR